MYDIFLSSCNYHGTLVSNQIIWKLERISNNLIVSLLLIQQISFYFISCPVDDTTIIYPSPSGYYRFGLEAFEFVNQTFVFIHCHVVICNTTDPQSRCAQGCQKNSRPRRNIGDHTVYSLSQGPITLDYTDVSENNNAYSAKITNPAGKLALFEIYPLYDFSFTKIFTPL